jgi:hypothetical protein
MQIRRQMQRVQNQRCRFVNSIRRTVTKMDAGRIHTRGTPANKVTYRVQTLKNRIGIWHQVPRALNQVIAVEI